MEDVPIERSEPHKDVLSREEIDAAIEGLTDNQWARLRLVAEKWCQGRPIEGKDLLQEALMRALDSRQCPRGVDIVRFLAEAMRSIADAEVKSHDRKPQKRADSIHGDGDEDVGIVLVDGGPSPEMLIADEERCAGIRKAILGLFREETVLEVLAEGIMDGYEGEDLRSLTELDPTAFNSARRRIRRTIHKAFPDGKIS